MSGTPMPFNVLLNSKKLLRVHKLPPLPISQELRLLRLFPLKLVQAAPNEFTEAAAKIATAKRVFFI